MRVVTYNVHECVGRDGRFDPDRIANVLLEIDAEIMALQEMMLDPEGARVARLEAVTRSRLIDGTLFHRRMARFGNVLLTRHAVIETRLHDLSCERGEPRGVIESTLEIAHRPIRVCATHLGFMQCERSRQMELLADLVRGSPGIALVLGDFNLWRSANAVPLFRQGFEQIPVRSFPIRPFPLLALDGIFARSPFTIERCWRHDSKLARMASDHFPVVAEIGITIPKADLFEALELSGNAACSRRRSNVMHPCSILLRTKPAIAALLLAAVVLLSGCSLTELAYDNAHWWIRNRIDDYFDLTSTQDEFVDARLQALVRWHRYEELPRYAEQIRTFSKRIRDGMTRAELEELIEFLNRARLRLVRKALPDLARFLATITPEQLQHFHAKIRESIAEDMERASLSTEERRSERSEKIIAILEPWFDGFSDRQSQHIRLASNALPDLFPRWLEQRKRRHDAFMRMMAKGPDTKTIHDRLHSWWSDIGADYPPDMRKDRDRLWSAWLDLLVEIDNLLTPAQRRHALERLAEFREEFIRLSATGQDDGPPLLGGPNH